MNISDKSKKIFEERVKEIFNEHTKVEYREKYIFISVIGNWGEVSFNYKDKLITVSDCLTLDQSMQLNSLLSDFCKWELGTCDE